MMTKSTHKQGFTLIEIIVGLIIVGILAAIALPNLFNNVARGRASAALETISSMKSELEGCAAMNNINPLNSNICAPANYGPMYTNGFNISIATTTEGQYPGAGAFVASSGTPSAGNLTYSILAIAPDSEVVALTRNTDGSFTCSAPAQGVYADVC